MTPKRGLLKKTSVFVRVPVRVKSHLYGSSITQSMSRVEYFLPLTTYLQGEGTGSLPWWDPMLDMVESLWE